MMKLFMAAALCAVALPSVAQASPADAGPAMWVVKDEDTTIYLFGTIHVLDGKRDWFRGKVKAAFEESEEVVLEALLPESRAELKPLVDKYAIDPQGRTLSSKLPVEVRTKYVRALRAAGVSPQSFEPLEPWFASMAITQIAGRSPGFRAELGPEAILTRAARARGVPVGELEGLEYQLSLFDRMPEAQQVDFLDRTLDGADKAGETMEPMLAAWASGDTDGLARILNDSVEDNRPFYDLLFTHRNLNWADWIETRLDRPGTLFVAVGAGHLGGRNNVQQLLAERGIKSERVA